MALKKDYHVVEVKKDNVQAMFDAVDALTTNKLYVGVPDINATREPDPDDEPGEPITNAALAYIHNNGSPARNIPARPFMTLGMQDARPQVEKTMFKLANFALAGQKDDVIKGLNALGLYVATKIQRRLQTGPWTPLSPRTVRAKFNRRISNKGKPFDQKAYQKYMTPLIDTARLLKSITYVIRNK